METLETEKPLLKPVSDHSVDMTRRRGRNGVVSILLQPFQWLQMLSSKLNPSFVLGVVLVYGLNQGFSGSIFKVVTDYYWKDVQQVEPSVVQLYMGLYYIPWVMRPVWGLFTDVFPIRGYKRKPYFVVAGVLGVVSAVAVVVFGKLPAALALSCLLGVSAAMAIAEVVIDACIATNSISIRSLAPDIQSLCMVCSSAGALVGYATSGVFVHWLGPQGALGVLALPPATIIVLGIFIYEKRSSTFLIQKNKMEADGLGVAVKGMYKTIKYPQVWKPSLYMFISLALNVSTHEGYFYWYTDPKAGPAFSQEFVGIIYAIGALASMFGVLIYHKKLKSYSFRNTLFFAQLLYALSGTLDLVFIKRWNILLGIPDSFFVVTEESFSRIISKIRWIPMVVLSTRLCPLGIEGTFFAFLMCIDSFGQLASKWSGGLVLHAFGVSITIQSTNLFAALDTRKKKKKTDKAGKSKGSSSSSSSKTQKEPEPQVFWAPTPLKVKSWADIDDDDEDDDYYATTAPPLPSGWTTSEPKDTPVEESESEEDVLDEGDDDVDEEHETEVQVHPEPEPEVKKAPEAPAPPKEAERQLSKKERKRKELAELEALLADFGVAPKEDNGQEEAKEEINGEGEKKENAAGGESKASKKKKKKDKQKEVKESQEQQANADEAAGSEPTEEESAIDVKERLKKIASMKKKKSSKEMDAGAKTAAQEAAARRAKLAAAKKKEKNHYNQQPVR